MSINTRLHPQYIVDGNGLRKSVVLPLEEFEELLEDLDDLAVAAERRSEPGVSHEEAIEELKRDAHLPG